MYYDMFSFPSSFKLQASEVQSYHTALHITHRTPAKSVHRSGPFKAFVSFLSPPFSRVKASINESVVIFSCRSAVTLGCLMELRYKYDIYEQSFYYVQVLYLAVS